MLTTENLPTQAKTFARVASLVENIAGPAQSREAAKKRKNAAAATTAQSLNKQPWASPPEVPPQVNPTAGASRNDGNDPPTEGTQANAVTPAQPA